MVGRGRPAGRNANVRRRHCGRPIAGVRRFLMVVEPGQQPGPGDHDVTAQPSGWQVPTGDQASYRPWADADPLGGRRNGQGRPQLGHLPNRCLCGVAERRPGFLSGSGFGCSVVRPADGCGQQRGWSSGGSFGRRTGGINGGTAGAAGGRSRAAVGGEQQWIPTSLPVDVCSDQVEDGLLGGSDRQNAGSGFVAGLLDVAVRPARPVPAAVRGLLSLSAVDERRRLASRHRSRQPSVTGTLQWRRSAIFTASSGSLMPSPHKQPSNVRTADQPR